MYNSNPRGTTMEMKRNLEGVYKLRFEKTETKRHQLELQLNIINCYARVCEDGGLTTSAETQGFFDEIHSRLAQVESLVQDVRHLLVKEPISSSRRNGLTQMELQDCEFLSKLELENISYSPQKVFLTTIAETLKPFNVTYSYLDQVESLKSSCHITCDPTNLMRVLRAVKVIFPSKTGEARLSYDAATSALVIRMSDSADHSALANLFEQVEQIIAGQHVPLEYRNISMLFIAKCLTQSMGGDVSLEGTEVVIAIPGDLDCPTATEGEGTPASAASITAGLTVEPTAPRAYPETEHRNLPVEEKGSADQVIATPGVRTEVNSGSNGSSANRSNGLKTIPGLSPVDVLKGRNLNILLVEDNSILQDVFKRWWEKRGHNVFIAKDGQEAVNKFKEQNFSIVFSDIQLPIKDGFAVTREIRAYELEKGRAPTPIIGVSGHERNLYAQRAISSGMNDFTSKGTTFQMQKIYDLVVKYCV